MFKELALFPHLLTFAGSSLKTVTPTCAKNVGPLNKYWLLEDLLNTSKNLQIIKNNKKM